MKFTNNGRVRVAATMVQIGADDDVKMWRGNEKLWPPVTLAKIKAFSVDPSYDSSLVQSELTFNRWSFLAIRRMLETGRGTASVDGRSVARLDGYTVYLRDKPTNGDWRYKVDAYIRVDLEITQSAAVSGVVNPLGSLRLESDMPFGNEAVTFSCQRSNQSQKMTVAYTMRCGYVFEGVDYLMDSISWRHSSSSDYNANYFAKGFSGKTVADYQDIQIQYPAPEKFYIEVENTKSEFANETLVTYNPFFFGSCAARGIITQLYM